MKKISRRRLAQTVARLLQERPGEQRHILRMTAAYLIAHKQEHHADLLMLDIAHQLEQTAGHLYADVTSPFSLDAGAREQLRAYLRTATGAAEIELNEHLDESLLTGVIVKTADYQLDSSARTKLQRLGTHLTTRDI